MFLFCGEKNDKNVTLKGTLEATFMFGDTIWCS